MVTPQNHKNVQAFLERNCAGMERMFTPDPVFCAQLPKCYQLWDDVFPSDWFKNGSKGLKVGDLAIDEDSSSTTTSPASATIKSEL